MVSKILRVSSGKFETQKEHRTHSFSWYLQAKIISFTKTSIMQPNRWDKDTNACYYHYICIIGKLAEDNYVNKGKNLKIIEISPHVLLNLIISSCIAVGNALNGKELLYYIRKFAYCYLYIYSSISLVIKVKSNAIYRVYNIWITIFVIVHVRPVNYREIIVSNLRIRASNNK